MADETRAWENATPTDSRSESYNGWTNRETWAVALHINNDQGWQESVHEALREAIADVGRFWDAEGETSISDATAGEIIRENVEETLTGDIEASDFAGNPIVAYTTEQDMAREDIGSLWRVNWTELGAAFLSDLDES